MAEMASIPTIKLNQIMYSAWSRILERTAISLENRLAIKMKTEDVVVIEKDYYCKLISFHLVYC